MRMLKRDRLTGDGLRIARKRLGMTQGELALRLGLNQPGISERELGMVRISLSETCFMQWLLDDAEKWPDDGWEGLNEDNTEERA